MKSPEFSSESSVKDNQVVLLPDEAPVQVEDELVEVNTEDELSEELAKKNDILE